LKSGHYQTFQNIEIMQSYITFDTHIGLSTKVKFTEKETWELRKLFNKELSDFIQTKIPDLALQFPKLLEGYSLEIFPDSNNFY
jgi:hypothetical protein